MRMSKGSRQPLSNHYFRNVMKSVVLQVDFSENATIASQCEVQSAHWNHGQATFFKAHAWIKRDTLEGQSMVIVSDDLNHTKY